MDVAKKIDPPPWMCDDALRRVMDALNNGDKKPQALLVGGCVRNMLVGKAVDDIDIATKHAPEKTMALLDAVGIKSVPTGLGHGTVTAVMGDKSFEITTLRSDVETDGRHAVVAFTKDWCEDAQRRDFTMNTLLCDLEGRIFDPTGRGLKDLEARRVVFVGDPAARIAEDYLRILRFFRFYGTYGHGHPDENALQACRDAAVHVLDLSKERITQEFMKILAVDNVVGLLPLMRENNILTPLFHQNYDAEIMERVVQLQNRHDAANVIARVAVLAGFDGKYPEAVGDYILLSNKEKSFFGVLLQSYNEINEPSEKEAKFLVYKVGVDISVQAMLLYGASHKAEIPADLINFMKRWQVPKFPIDGNDIKKAGVEDGPLIGEMLSYLESWWMEQDFKPDRSACLEKLRSLIK